MHNRLQQLLLQQRCAVTSNSVAADAVAAAAVAVDVVAVSAVTVGAGAGAVVAADTEAAAAPGPLPATSQFSTFAGISKSPLPLPAARIPPLTPAAAQTPRRHASPLSSAAQILRLCRRRKQILCRRLQHKSRGVIVSSGKLPSSVLVWIRRSCHPLLPAL